MVVWTSQAGAATIAVQGSAIRITGQIEIGDLRKLQDLLWTADGMRAFSSTGTFILDSSGGRVVEALKIAQIVELGFGTTVVPAGSKCYSACFLVFAAGSYRSAGEGAALGVHQVAMAKSSPKDAASAASLLRVGTGVASYLKSRGIPHQVIDKMNSTPASDMFAFGNRWMMDQGIDDQMGGEPRFMALVHQRCGQDPHDLEPGRTPAADSPALHHSWLGCMALVRNHSRTAGRPYLLELMGVRQDARTREITGLSAEGRGRSR